MIKSSEFLLGTFSFLNSKENHLLIFEMIEIAAAGIVYLSTARGFVYIFMMIISMYY